MKTILLPLLATLALTSCEQSETTNDDRTECEKALDYINQCVGYTPYFRTCTDEMANKILSTPCENIKELWR
jgi:hypothetical protein